jgi:hypothetical protein
MALAWAYWVLSHFGATLSRGPGRRAESSCRMSKIWRWIVPIAAAGGLIVSGAVSAADAGTSAPARHAQVPVVTISVKSPLPVVTHDVWVVYNLSTDGDNTVTISGTVSESTAGQVAALYAQPFPYSTPAAPVPGQTLTLSASTTPTAYSFTAEPTIATKYTVEVLPSSTVTTPVVGQSSTDTVYVVTDQTLTSSKCGRPVCHLTLHIYTRLPKSAYAKESGKKWYFYFADKLSTTGEPPFPKWIYLQKKAKISKPKKISSTEFERTITWKFRIGNDGYSYVFNFCSKDSESKDGINLPGSHSCGVKKIKRTIIYLG